MGMEKPELFDPLNPTVLPLWQMWAKGNHGDVARDLAKQNPALTALFIVQGCHDRRLTISACNELANLMLDLQQEELNVGSTPIKDPRRCWECSHCVKVERAQKVALWALSHKDARDRDASDAIMMVWNDTLTSFPCQDPPSFGGYAGPPKEPVEPPPGQWHWQVRLMVPIYGLHKDAEAEAKSLALKQIAEVSRLSIGPQYAPEDLDLRFEVEAEYVCLSND